MYLIVRKLRGMKSESINYRFETLSLSLSLQVLIVVFQRLEYRHLYFRCPAFFVFWLLESVAYLILTYLQSLQLPKVRLDCIFSIRSCILVYSRDVLILSILYALTTTKYRVHLANSTRVLNTLFS